MAKSNRKENRDVWHHVGRGAETFVKHAGPVASTIASLAALINIEKKFYDIGPTKATFTSGAYGGYSPTANLPQGDGQSQCIGNSVKLLSIYLKYKFIANDTYADTSSPQYCRVIAVVDRDSNGAAPALSDILQTTGTANWESMISPLNKTTSFAAGTPGGPRFSILLDRVHNIEKSANAQSTNLHEHYWDQQNKFGDDHHCLWSDDAHSASTILGGHIFIFMIYTHLAVSATTPTYATGDTTNPPGALIYTRMRYTDD